MRNSKKQKQEKTFKKKLDVPTANDFDQECSCPDGTHVSSDTCSSCNYQFVSHSRERDANEDSEEEEDTSDAEEVRAVYKHRCPPGWTQSFRCKKSHILKTCNESGKFEKTFDIAKQSDQTKLEKFLEFIDS